MNILIREVNDQKESISNFFHFLERLEFNELIINDINLGEDSRYTLPIGISTVQKSSCIILLYNFIESVITNLISKIHDEIIRNNINFFDLNSDIRNTVIMYYSNIVEKMNFKNSAPHIQEIFLLLANTKKMGLTYKKLSEFYSLYSGNLDSREARKVFQHYGINILRDEGGLRTIKNGRNKLAHGELTFEEYGRTLTIQQLKDLKEKVFIYFDSLLSQVKEYIERENYLEANNGEE